MSFILLNCGMNGYYLLSAPHQIAEDINRYSLEFHMSGWPIREMTMDIGKLSMLSLVISVLSSMMVMKLSLDG